MLKINPFVRKFKRNDIVALFNSITLSTVYFTDDVYEHVVQNPTKDLLKYNFFVKGNFDAHDYLRDYVQSIKGRSTLGIAYFLVTSDCNYKCNYCFVETRFDKSPKAKMTKRIASKGIQLIKRNTNKIKILFYGGEPLLNFDVIKHIVEESKKNKLKATYSIVSNGSIMNDEIIDFIKANKISFSISLDGAKETNDEMRKYHNNVGTFNKIRKTLCRLKDANIRFGISCTISPSNMEKPEEILQILNEFDVKSFGYNLLTENDNIKYSEKDNITMVKNILKAEDLIFEKRIVEDRIINRKLKPFVEKKNWLRDCAGYGHQIVITPKGEVGTCHGLWPDLVNKETNNCFDINVDYKGKILEHPTWKEWFHRIPFNMPQCWNCIGLGLCGGGCAKNSLLREGSIWDIDKDICVLTKESVPWVIWKYFDTKVKNKMEKTLSNKAKQKKTRNAREKKNLKKNIV
jgi:uncharacterized protein